jgi:hypothetical protein
MLDVTPLRRAGDGIEPRTELREGACRRIASHRLAVPRREECRLQR